jgi:hypothetical protein
VGEACHAVNRLAQAFHISLLGVLDHAPDQPLELLLARGERGEPRGVQVEVDAQNGISIAAQPVESSERSQANRRCGPVISPRILMYGVASVSRRDSRNISCPVHLEQPYRLGADRMASRDALASAIPTIVNVVFYGRKMIAMQGVGSVREVLPGVFHWSAIHPRIHIEVSSYWYDDGAVLIDPLIPADVGLLWFEQRPTPPSAILLSNRHHKTRVRVC